MADATWLRTRTTRRTTPKSEWCDEPSTIPEMLGLLGGTLNVPPVRLIWEIQAAFLRRSSINEATGRSLPVRDRLVTAFHYGFACRGILQGYMVGEVYLIWEIPIYAT